MPKLGLGRLLIGIRRFISRLTYYEAYIITLKRLEERSALEDLGRITASLEHDLRLPIVTMGHHISLMKRQFQNDGRIVDGLNELEKQLRRIQDGLAITSVMRGGAEYFERFMTKTNVEEVIHRAIKHVKKEFERIDSIVFTVSGRSLFIRADHRMIEHALSYILKNSIEAIREAKRDRGLISITMTKLERMAVLEIVDNGCGFPEENVSRIGQLFTSKNYGGVNRGLGLFRAARILDVHDGKLKVDSEQGKGTTISVLLPLWNDA